MQFQIDNIYGTKRQLLISRADIEVTKNAITVISGENGAGKTLLLNKMFELCVEAGISAEYVEQSNKYLLANASILENIVMSDEATEIDKAKNALCEIGMSHLISHKPNELSGGEKRIICLLKGLFASCDVVFIDEPTNDLDFSAVETIKTLLIKLKRKKTIVIVSHDDRIRNIADDIVVVWDKKINCTRAISLNDIQDAEEKNIEMHKRNHTTLLKTSCKHNYLSCVVMIIIFFLSIYSISIYMNGLKIETPKMAHNEINIFSPVSQLSMDIASNGIIPIGALCCFDESLSLNEKLDIYTSSFNVSNEMPINYGLDLEDGTDYTVFELEYYDTINKEFYFTLDNYKQLFGVNSEESVDTESYFVIGGIDVPKSKDRFCVEKFEKSQNDLVNSLNSKSLECTFLAISLDTDKNFSDFIVSDAMSHLMNGNFYIRSAETIALTENLKHFQSVRNMLLFLPCMGLLLFLVDIILTFCCLFSNRLVIRLFRNTGMLWSEIYGETIRQYTMPVFRLLIVVVSVIANVGIQLYKEVPLTAGAFIGVIFVLFYTLLAKRTIAFIARRYIKGICSWRYR